jgi:hypothetical protein
MLSGLSCLRDLCSLLGGCDLRRRSRLGRRSSLSLLLGNDRRNLPLSLRECGVLLILRCSGLLGGYLGCLCRVGGLGLFGLKA